jgi:hypothetical protein
MKKSVIIAAFISSTAIVSGCDWIPDAQTRAAPPVDAPEAAAAGTPARADPRPFIPRGGPDGSNDSDTGGGFGGGDSGNSGGNDDAGGGFGGSEPGAGGAGGWG